MRVEQLLGRKVLDANGQTIGHIEEILAEPNGDELEVTEFHVGRAALAERLSLHGIAMTFLGWFGARRYTSKPRRIKWSDLDLSDPHHPRLKR